jgi:hypothetical protein
VYEHQKPRIVRFWPYRPRNLILIIKMTDADRKMKDGHVVLAFSEVTSAVFGVVARLRCGVFIKMGETRHMMW